MPVLGHMSQRYNQPYGARAAPNRLAPAVGWRMLFCQMAMASPFMISAIAKTADFGAARAEMTAVTGMPEVSMPLAIAVISTQFTGSICLFGGRQVRRLGVIILCAFTMVATLVAHDVLGNTGAERARQLITVFEHLAIIGGLTLMLLRAEPL